MQHKIYIQGFIETDPFFYIIRQKQTGMLYAGSKWSQEVRQPCNSSTFMTEGGYPTSCKRIKGLINLYGLDSFEVMRIRHFSTGAEAYAYETRFLRKVKAKRNPMFYNKHDNNSLINEFNTKGMIWYHRGEDKKMFYPGEIIPTGWIKGSPHKIGECGKGKVYYHDGKISRRFFEGEQPDGWIKGNLGVRGEKNGCFGKKSTVSGCKCFTNGIDCCYIMDDDIIPEGFYLGVTDKFKQRRSELTKGSANPRFGTRAYNNGVIVKHFIPGTEPVEFIIGGLQKWYNNGSINKLYIPGTEPVEFTIGSKNEKI